MGFMKQRDMGSQARVGDQARKRAAQRTGGGGGGGGGGRSMSVGRFDRFFANEVPIWLNVSAYALFKQRVYNKTEKQVIDTETIWFEYERHFIPRNKDKYVNGRRAESETICSCGADRDKPCYGCAIRDNHYDMMRAIEAEKGVRPQDRSPVSRQTQFALPITVMEKIYAVPVLDKDGKPRKSKAGALIYKYMPAPIVESKHTGDVSALKYKSDYGHRYHWSLGVEQLDALGDFDTQLMNKCATCAGNLFCKTLACPDCCYEIELPQPISEIDLTMARTKERVCGTCHSQTVFIPVKLICPDCGTPEEGRLTSFDLRIRGVKVGNKWGLELLGVRIPGVQGNDELNKRILDLIQNPLNLAEIFAPTPIDAQKAIYGKELTDGISPKLKKYDGGATDTDTESYADDEKIKW